MVKTRDLFKKIGAIKGTFHVETGTIKNKNIKELIEAEEIKKRWQEYTEELYKKACHIRELIIIGVQCPHILLDGYNAMSSS